MCSEQIPTGSKTCPLCKESLSASKGDSNFVLDDAQRAALTARVQESLQSSSPTIEDQLRGPLLSRKSIVLIAIMGACALMFLAGMMIKQGDGLVAMGVMFGVVFIIPMIVSVANDSSASNIQSSSTAQQALSRFLMSVRTGRGAKAYAAVAPLSRDVSQAQTIKFTNPKIENIPRTFAFSDAKSFMNYWKYNFAAPSMTSRSTNIKNVRSIGRTPEGLEVVEATFEVTSHSTWLFLTIFLGLLIALILILALQQKEEVVIRKTLIQHNGRWYILDGSLEGELDRMI